MSEIQQDQQSAVSLSCPVTTGEPKDLASLASKIAQVMGKINRLEKRGHNDRFNYDYVLQEDVYDAIRAAMAEVKLAFIPAMTHVDNRTYTAKSGNAFVISRVTFHFTFIDGETGATITTPWIGEGMDDQDKSLTKGSAQAAKYFLLRTFVMSTGDSDPDGDSGNQNQGKAKGKQAQVRAGNGSQQVKAASTAGNGAQSKATEPVDHNDETLQSLVVSLLKAAAAAGVDLVAASGAVSPKGAKLGTLTDDQLGQLVMANTEKVTTEMKIAAAVLYDTRRAARVKAGE